LVKRLLDELDVAHTSKQGQADNFRLHQDVFGDVENIHAGGLKADGNDGGQRQAGDGDTEILGFHCDS